MKSLTKEGFWNELKEMYPNAVDLFCKWIDEYKKKVEWHSLFTSGLGFTHPYMVPPKFHEIPYEMQIGILNQFFIDYGWCYLVSTRKYNGIVWQWKLLQVLNEQTWIADQDEILSFTTKRNCEIYCIKMIFKALQIIHDGPESKGTPFEMKPKENPSIDDRDEMREIHKAHGWNYHPDR